MTLRFHLDRCALSEIVGWIDDDGPVNPIDVELHGNWICSLSPSIYRPDLAAAGYGDGKRGFALSVSRFLAAEPAGCSYRVTLKYKSLVFYEGLVANLTDYAALLGGEASLSARLIQLEERAAEAADLLRIDRHRIDAALFLSEGLSPLRDEFLAARATAAYQAVFDKCEPLVSVCIATMNRAELLIERALSSLAAQTYHNLQIIVVGDHCTDDTAERIAGLRDPRITYVNLPKRGPYPPSGWDRWLVGGTWPGNRALALVEGDFVTELDEDDTYDPRRIEILLQKIRETRADLVFHRFWWEKPDGNWTERGNGSFEFAQTGTGMVFYHRYLARILWDVFAYRLGEPGDWNRLRKFKMMGVRTAFVPALLTRHFWFPRREAFAANSEDFLE